MNPWVIIGIVALWGLSLFGVGKWQYGVGEEHERVAWQTKENKELAAANSEITRLTKAEKKATEEGAKNVAAIGSELEKEKRSHAKTRAARDAALRSGAARVSVAVTGCEGSVGPGGATTAADPGEPPTSRAFLHPAVAADLEQLAGDADDTARDLNACLAVAEEDRRIIKQWFSAVSNTGASP